MASDREIIKKTLENHREDIKKIVEEFSPEEMDIVEPLLENILSNIDDFIEKRDNILMGDKALGFFGGGLLTLVLVAIITEFAKSTASFLTKAGLQKLKKVAKRLFKKSNVDIDEKSKEEIIERLVEVIAGRY